MGVDKVKNEPAFPVKFVMTNEVGINSDYVYLGITKREYFAAMAMQGMLSAGKEQYTIDGEKMNLAKASLYIADAMLAESEKSDSDK